MTLSPVLLAVSFAATGASGATPPGGRPAAAARLDLAQRTPEGADTAAPAASPGPELVLVFDLADLLGRAGEHYPELAIVAAETEGARALRSLAHWTRWSPTMKNVTVLGLVPAARGDIFFSPDDAQSIADLGPFYRTRIDASLPLYTFGRLDAADDAADALVASTEAKAEAKRAVAHGLAARAYYGWLLATKSLDVMAGVRKDLDEMIGRLEHPGEDDPEPDPIDLFKARNYEFQLDRQEQEARTGLAIASAGLQALAGVPPGTAVQPRATDLVPLLAGDAPDPDLDQGIATALAASPQIREAELGTRARERWAEVARRELLPVLGLEARFEVGGASNRDEQDNPFVYDPFHVKTLGAALGIKWDLSFFQLRARARKELAEAAELRARRDALAAKLRVDVTEKHARLVAARRLHERSRRALSSTANWLRVSEENHGLGTGSLKDVVDAYAAFVQTRAAHLESVHDLNLALIDWRLALGAPPLQQGEAP